MDLDRRILEGRKYLDLFDTKEAQKYVGTKCYFTDKIARFSNLDDSQLVKATLTNVKTGDYEYCYGSDEIGVDGRYYARYILPLEWVKPKKTYRPYKNVDELFDDVGLYIGDVIHFRKKFDESEYNELITGTCCDSKGVSEICIGSYYTMQELFDLLELPSVDSWVPFGKECEECENEN